MHNKFVSLALVAVLSLPALAQKVSMSDAQVEANVLRAMAADSLLTSQPIQSSTAFGVVTLTGAVQNNAARDRAEQIASRTEGVKKVVDQLSVGAAAVQAASAPSTQSSQVAQNSADDDPASVNTLPEDNTGSMASGNQQPLAQTDGQYPAQAGQQSPAQPGQYPPQNGQYPAQTGQQYPPQASQQYPLPGQGDGSVGSQASPAYPQQGGYNQQGGYPQQQGAYAQPGNPQAGNGQPAPHMYRRDWERQQAMQNGSYAPPAQQGQPQGQPAGLAVTIPAGVVLPVRITRWVDSHDAQPGSQFTAVVNNDILANGLVAIPRGAEVQGTVVEAKGAGILKGRGELVLQLNTLDLGGRQIPIVSDTFQVNGHDKTARSVNSTIIGGAVGALFGAAIGGGTGAAIGAGVGGAAGLGTSAASRSGNVDIPAEALLQFRLTAPLPVVTVSEAEMQRLGSFAGPQGARRPVPAYGYGAYPPPPPYYYGRPYRGYYSY